MGEGKRSIILWGSRLESPPTVSSTRLGKFPLGAACCRADSLVSEAAMRDATFPRGDIQTVNPKNRPKHWGSKWFNTTLSVYRDKAKARGERCRFPVSAELVKAFFTANKSWTKEAEGLGYLEMHEPATGKKKTIKMAAKTRYYKILKCYFVVTGENSEFCLQFNLSVPEVNKKEEQLMFLLKAMLSVQ